MKKLPIVSIAALILTTLCATQPAHAAMLTTVPEIDPGAAVTALALLGGGLVVVRARFRK